VVKQKAGSIHCGIQNEQSVITRSNRHWVTYGGIAPPDTPIR